MIHNFIRRNNNTMENAKSTTKFFQPSYNLSLPPLTHGSHLPSHPPLPSPATWAPPDPTTSPLFESKPERS
ncbi:hypothetical protein M6B38_129880 [Iris pallida]|uniref:Uncharacterized protein n=1 Tax=Iris pallida TaxID=29817 RepID=A0AAX6G682_IRIPA|nr:hypothetical protein M6B38_129880 [Iris pallida]